jgi:hypothetical protein
MTAKPEGIPGDPIGHIHSRMKARNDSLSSGSCLDHGQFGSNCCKQAITPTTRSMSVTHSLSFLREGTKPQSAGITSGLPTNQELTTMAGIRTQPYCYFERSFSLHRTAGSISCRALSIKALERTFQSVGHEQELGLASS